MIVSRNRLSRVVSLMLLNAIVCTLVRSDVFAQDRIALDTQSYGKGRMLLSDGSKIYFSNITLAREEYIYVQEHLLRTRVDGRLHHTSKKVLRYADTLSIEANRVSAVEIEMGTKAREWSGYGCIGGLIAGAIAAYGGSKPEWCHKYPLYESESCQGRTSDEKWTIIFLSGAAGALIGGLIGCSMKKYNVVQDNDTARPVTESIRFGLRKLDDTIVLSARYDLWP